MVFYIFNKHKHEKEAENEAEKNTREFLKKMHGNEYFSCKECGEEFPLPEKGDFSQHFKTIDKVICPKCGGSDVAYAIAHFFHKEPSWKKFFRAIFP